jgi:hypothetical protein
MSSGGIFLGFQPGIGVLPPGGNGNNPDGGTAGTIYLSTQMVAGGNAGSTGSTVIDGGNASTVVTL